MALMKGDRVRVVHFNSEDPAYEDAKELVGQTGTVTGWDSMYFDVTLDNPVGGHSDWPLAQDEIEAII